MDIHVAGGQAHGHEADLLRQGHAQVLDGALAMRLAARYSFGVLVLDVSEVGLRDPAARLQPLEGAAEMRVERREEQGLVPKAQFVAGDGQHLPHHVGDGAVHKLAKGVCAAGGRDALGPEPSQVAADFLLHQLADGGVELLAGDR